MRNPDRSLPPIEYTYENVVVLAGGFVTGLTFQFGGFEQVEGDPRLAGRVYLGTLGRGIIYGDPL